jgi:hypothetical protein
MYDQPAECLADLVYRRFVLSVPDYYHADRLATSHFDLQLLHLLREYL